MRPQFPGMDPWLEHPDLWPDVHNSLITAMRDVLSPLVLPRYFVGVDSRTTVLTGMDVERVYRSDVLVHAVEPPAKVRGTNVAAGAQSSVRTIEVIVPVQEDEIEETFLTIKELPGRKLVTVIELLSPTNKKTKDARAEYLERRRKLIRGGVHFVEIDLLRAGEPMPLINSAPPSDYRILICRREHAKRAVLHAFSWTVPIPLISIPLLPGDAEPTLDVNSVLHSLMDRVQYDVVVNYKKPPEPPLRPEDEPWAAAITARAADQTADSTPGNGTAS
jgi:Protein of unknown function (DUF4058)